MKKSRLLFLCAFAVAAAAALFLLGVFTRHYQTPPWTWMQAGVQELRKIRSQKAERVQTILTTSLLNFDFVIHNANTPIMGSGGGLAVMNEGVLITHSQTGEIYFYDKTAQTINRLSLLLPKNNFNRLPGQTASGKGINRGWLRYNDIEVIERNGIASLLVSYTYYHPRKLCFSNRLAVREVKSDWRTVSNKETPKASRGWKVVFETSPCVPFHKGPKEHPFVGHQAGGRLAVADDGFIYLTVGDFKFDGVGTRTPAYSQIQDNHYGKIIRINPLDWSSSVFSLGHRNPQGITVDSQGKIWSVEHGPMGGDELNLIREGANFGWPYVTLGVNYGRIRDDNKRWPLSSHQGRHNKYERPVLAWLPSIGVSNLKHIDKFHPRWDGDLLVSATTGKALHRIRLAGGRAIYDERIPLGSRVRYVDIGKSEIYILFDNGQFATMRPRPTADTSGLEVEANALASSGAIRSPKRARRGLDTLPDNRKLRLLPMGCRATRR